MTANGSQPVNNGVRGAFRVKTSARLGWKYATDGVSLRKEQGWRRKPHSIAAETETGERGREELVLLEYEKGCKVGSQRTEDL